MTSPAPALRCRPIAEGDLADVAMLLSEGFPDRDRAYWDRALRVLRDRDAPSDYPRYGLFLEANGQCAGVLLQIYTRGSDGDAAGVRCNNSSWYVAPPFRSHAALLVSRALRHKEVTYLNVSPAEPTWPILTAQGYRRYSEGQVAALAWLSHRGTGARVRPYRPGQSGLPRDEAAILDTHAERGLLVATCRTGGQESGFAFLRRTVQGVPAAQLAWCESTDAFVRFAGPLGRWLLGKGHPVVLLDATAPMPELVGRFFKDRAPKYYRGARPPRLNDLAYTEAALFGA